MCRDLNEVGIPYCNGYCMAVNPLWRKTLPQWIAQIGQWTRKGSIVAVRLADIFFDFQPVWGEDELARELRRAVTGLVRDNRSFLRQMYQDKLEHNVALGLFGGFVTERDKRDYRGQVNLKYTGTLPLVSGIRLLALREGVEETSTLQRIRALAEQGVLDGGERDEPLGGLPRRHRRAAAPADRRLPGGPAGRLLRRPGVARQARSRHPAGRAASDPRAAQTGASGIRRAPVLKQRSGRRVTAGRLS